MTWHIKSRRNAIRIISFLIGAFLVVGGFAIQGHKQAAEYRWYLQTNYQHAFSELTTAIDELDTALQKGIYATSPCMLSSLLTQIYGKAMAAQLALSRLPYSFVELEQTSAFVAKTGDYALSLARNSTLNGGIDETQWDGLQKLASVSSHLAQSLRNLQAELYGGSLLMDVDTMQAQLSQQTGDDGQLSAGSVFQDMESDYPEIPTLIYDGPFSEHLTGQRPLFLEGLPYVSQEEAASVAAEFLGMPVQALTLISGGEGNMPTWGFSAEKDGGELFIEVTQIGGKVVNLFTSAPVQEQVISKEEGLARAEAFLEEHGYPDMTDTYWIVEENRMSINFCPLVEDTLIYPDLIRVTVALDDGEIIGFEAKGYFTNHTQRQLPELLITEEQAREKILDSLEVLSCRKALIPSAGKYEVLCLEFKCQAPEGQHIIIYVNALNGEQEKILLLLEDESGTLVI